MSPPLRTALADIPGEPLIPQPPGLAGKVLIALRLAAIALLLSAALAIYLLLRLPEWLIFGKRRPVTPLISGIACSGALVVMGFYRIHCFGAPMRRKGAMVANHAGWIDILALSLRGRAFFVSKAEVAGWPVIGALARLIGTVFIARRGAEAKRQQMLFEERLQMGHRLLFFPEGTSSDAIRVLPFKSSLFEAFYSDALAHEMYIQPVTLVWQAPKGRDPRFYGWWGEMDFASHFLQVLAQPVQGRITLIYHPEVRVDDFASRKALALHCERVIRAAHDAALAGLAPSPLA